MSRPLAGAAPGSGLQPWQQQGFSPQMAGPDPGFNGGPPTPYGGPSSPTGGYSPTPAPFQTAPQTPEGAPPAWSSNSYNSGTDPSTGLIPGATDANGNVIGPSMVGNITLGQTPQISQNYSPGFVSNYNNTTAQIGNAASMPYNYNPGQEQAAQMNIGGIPQPTAQQYGGSGQLDQLLSGQGYDPATLARMHAGATDSVAGQSAMQLAQARNALGNAGLMDSPAGVGVQQDVARQAGQAQTQASNQIDINNAQVGNSNFLAGVGMQNQNGLSNMQQANQMALQNANLLFQGLSQNTQNQQAANSATFGANTNRLGQQAQAASNAAAQSGQAFQNAALSKASGAETQNASNAAAQNVNQANLNTGTAAQNQNTEEKRWGVGMGATAGFNPTAG